MTSAPGEYRIEPGQEYESHDPGHDAITTIRVGVFATTPVAPSRPLAAPRGAEQPSGVEPELRASVAQRGAQERDAGNGGA